MRIDRAFALGVSGGNGWQRLFEGTGLQFFFDGRTERGYKMIMEESEDGWSGWTSVDVSSADSDGRSDDLEAAWVKDLGATWKVRDPAQSVR